MRSAIDGIEAFNEAVDEFRRTRNSWTPIEPGQRNPGALMEDARTKALAAIKNAQTVMRDELDNL
jgi:hypothetical protein